MARPNQEAEGVRKNLRLTQASERRIQKIKREADLSSDAEVIRAALKEYTKIMDLQMSGARFFYREANGVSDIPVDPLYETERQTEGV